MTKNSDSKASTDPDDSGGGDGDKRKLKADRKVKENKKIKVEEKVEEDKVMMQPEEEIPNPQQGLPSILQLDDNCLLVIFTQLTILNALKLGSTCSRLFRLYRVSFEKRPSLDLNLVPECQYNHFKGEFSLITAAKLPASAHLQLKSYTSALNILPRLTNLLHLEIKEIEHIEKSLPLLVKTLNNSPLSKTLQSLKLYIRACKSDFPPVVEKTKPLKLPSLKHLSLYLIGKKHNPGGAVLTTTLFRSVLPQLTSLHLFANGSFKHLYRFVKRQVLRKNAHLAAAVGTSAFQVAFDTRKVLFCFNDEDEDEDFKDEEVLDTLTAIHVTDYLYCPEELLPVLTNLKKVAIRIRDISGLDPRTDYGSLISGLSFLEYLEELEVDNSEHWFNHDSFYRYEKNRLSVLPTVKYFSLVFASYCHHDPVEQLHLAYCFPELKQISVSLRQESCEICDYSWNEPKENDAETFRRCALILARGLLRMGKTGAGSNAWESKVQVKKVEATFIRKDGDIVYSSLENLVAGVKDD